MARVLSATAVVVVAAYYAAGWDLGFAWIDQLHDSALAWTWLQQGRWWPPHGTNVSGLGVNGPWSMWMTMTALRVWPADWAVAAWATTVNLAVVGVAMLAWWRGRLPRAAAWALLLIGTHPLWWEWSRVGLDVSFAGLPLAVLALALRRPTATAALVAGFAGSLAAQSHPSLFPGVAAALLVGLWCSGAPRRTAALWGLALVAGVAPYWSVLAAAELGRGGLRWTPLAEWPGLLPQLIDVPGRALAVRLGALDWSELGVLLRVAGWAWPAAAVAAVWGLRRRREVRVLAAAALASLLALGYDDRSHYHHVMHWDGWLVATGALAALGLARRRGGRVVLTGLLVLNLVATIVLQHHAAQTGSVAMADVFPLRDRGAVEHAATWRARTAVAAALARRGAATPYERARTGGDAALAFAEHGWWFLHDLEAGPPSPPVGDAQGAGTTSTATAPTAMAAGWRLGACTADSELLLPRLCLAPAAVPVWSLHDRYGHRVTGDVNRWRGRAGEPSGGGAAVLPARAVTAASFPLHLAPVAQVTAFAATASAPAALVRVRTPRHPLALDRDGRTRLALTQNGRALQPHATRRGYVLLEHVYRLRSPAPVSVHVATPTTGVAIFDLRVESSNEVARP